MMIWPNRAYSAPNLLSEQSQSMNCHLGASALPLDYHQMTKKHHFEGETNSADAKC